jgi:peptidoglycan/LPS O-acetylase OafA/YrhL
MRQPNPSEFSAMPYFPNLDGLRFFGFLIVFFSHGYIGTTGLFLDLNYRAAVGLDLFFVMSAFLITYRLIVESEKYGTISLRRFVFRRSLRVWPLYFAVVFLGFTSHYIMQNIVGGLEPLPPLWMFITFTMNFWMAQHGEAFLFFMVFLWSVCLEEQFYVFLGILTKFFERMIVPAALILIVGSIAYRYNFQNNTHQMMYHSVSLMGSFGFGMITAWLFHQSEKKGIHLLFNHRFFWPSIYAIFFANMVFFTSLYGDTFISFLDRPVLWLFMSLIVFGQCLSGRQFLPMGRFGIFRYLGKISYGLYVFHGIFILIFLKIPVEFDSYGLYHLTFRPLLIFGCTVFAASISYHYFEKPFLQLKSKFSSI